MATCTGVIASLQQHLPESQFKGELRIFHTPKYFLRGLLSNTAYVKHVVCIKPFVSPEGAV